jgi:hypothetical protein
MAAVSWRWSAAAGLALLLAACQDGGGPAAPVGAPSGPPRASAPAEGPPYGAEREFPRTDFSRHTVPYSEIIAGGPPRDGIPAIDRPRFVSVAEADAWLRPQEPVVALELAGEAKAYPLQVLIWHEIVNDVVGGVPVAVTWCPLCNTAIVFRREVEGQVLDFGTTGRLRFSNLIMYDRQTESWWQQGSGEAIVGSLAGKKLTFVAANLVSWQEFKRAHPQGRVLSRETGYDRPYGRNPYVGYDDVGQLPFLYQGPSVPDKLPAMARVLTVDMGTEAVAYPYQVLERVKVVNDVVAGQPIVVFWRPGTASPLDLSALAEGRDVGAGSAFSRLLEGRLLTFQAEGEGFRDAETGTTWDLLGRGLRGPLAGRQLQPVVAINHFWFSWAAFRPDTRIYQPQ